MMPVMGGLAALQTSARLGVAPDVRPAGAPEDSRRLAAVGLRTADQRDAQGQPAAGVSGLAPLPTESSEASAPTRARAPTTIIRSAPESDRPATAAGETERDGDADDRQRPAQSRSPSSAPAEATTRDAALRRSLRHYDLEHARAPAATRVDLTL